MIVLAVCLAIGTLARLLMSKRCAPLRDWIAGCSSHRRDPEDPHLDHRPIEQVAADLRRLGARYHHLDPRTPFVKVEAVRSAYDRALAECCDLLGVTHLLGVLSPGPARDSERSRVEYVLGDSGVQFPRAA